MPDIGDRYREEDERRVNTEPLDEKKKKQYENFKFDKPLIDNCYFESAPKKTPLDPSRRATKIIQGHSVMTDEEYDSNNQRMHQRNYGKIESDNDTASGRKKNKMRGRKGKYYSQVDDEDQSFLNDQNRDELDDDLDEEDSLHMIEEESVASLEAQPVKQEIAQQEIAQIENKKLED